MCSFNCGDDKKNKSKVVSESQSKHIKFEEYRNCLDGKIYREERENYVLISVNHEMYFQHIKKSTFPIFDDKRCYIN